MSSNTLRFISFTPEVFGGINSQNAPDMVIAFPDENQRIVELEGNQGRCKTSLLNFVRVMCGGDMPSSAINSIENDVRGTQEFAIGDRTYKVRMTKSGFSLSYTSPTEKGKIEGPKSHLQSLIGNIGLSPMDLKDMKGKEQIKWLRDVFRLTDEQKKTENTIAQNLQKSFDTRTGVNRDYDRMHKEVLATGYFRFDPDNKVFYHNDTHAADAEFVSKNHYDDESIKLRHEAAQTKSMQRQAAYSKIERYKESLQEEEVRVSDIKSQIAELELRLSMAEANVEKFKTGISDGDKWLLDNPDPSQELQDILTLMTNSGEVRSKSDAIQKADKKLEEFNKTEEHKIALDGEVEEYRAQMREFIKETTPPVDGLEVIVGDWHPEKNEGIYYHNRTPQQLSESEAWEFYLKLCKALDIKVVLLENISSMGSSAIEVINEFARSGGYVFCTKMNRKKADINISFHATYDE